MRNDLQRWWMPFTDNKDFKSNPRLLKSAKGVYYTTQDGQQVIDGSAGLWCCNVGHGRDEITTAVMEQLQNLDYAPAFHLGHEQAFVLASRLTSLSPDSLNHVFFTNSGSESVDTALKIALNYWRAKGQGHRRMLIGRQRGYHGTGFGGISVGGIPLNRKSFGTLLPSDHLAHTQLPENAFSRGQPEYGEHLAEELESIITVHDASNIACVILEPVAGSTGGLPAPKGYLQKIRNICTKHDILLIFDEVITGFGRLGHNFATQKYSVTPDIMTTAKGITNGVIPMGAVFVSDDIYHGTVDTANGIDLFHGYTYSGHPVATAAAFATLDIMENEGVVENVKSLTAYFEDMIHSLRDCPHVVDIRNEGFIGAVELAPIDGTPNARAMNVFDKGFRKHGIMTRVSGTSLTISPPLVCTESHLNEIGDKLRKSLCDTPL